MHKSIDYYAYEIGERIMRTTLDLPEDLIQEAMKITQINTKKGVIEFALKELIRKTDLLELKKYKGQIDLDIDLDTLRDRKVL